MIDVAKAKELFVASVSESPLFVVAERKLDILIRQAIEKGAPHVVVKKPTKYERQAFSVLARTNGFRFMDLDAEVGTKGVKVYGWSPA